MKDNIKYAYLETTNHCNLRCSFCNREEVIGKLNHMPLDRWETMLSNLKDHPIEECKLMGMGEPFLHPFFDRVTAKFKDFFPSARVIVATNCQYNIKEGSKMRERFQDSLKNIDMLYLSIDGYKQSYERDRSPAKWDKLLKFLEDLQTIRRSGCKIVINYVVNKQNIYDIPKIFSFLKKYNLEEFRLNIAQDWSEESLLKENENTWGYSASQFKFLKKYKQYIKGRSPWTWSDCFWPRHGLYATVEGHVKMCCLNTGAVPLGNLFENTIKDIRASLRYKEIEDGCSSNRPTSHCKNCSYKELSPLLEELSINN